MDGFNHLIIRLYKLSTNEVTKNVTFVTAPFTYVFPRIHHHPAAQEQPLSLILSQAIEKIIAQSKITFKMKYSRPNDKLRARPDFSPTIDTIDHA